MNSTLAVLSALMLILSAQAQGMDEKACPLDVRKATENVRPDDRSSESNDEHLDEKAGAAEAGKSAVSSADGKADLDNFNNGTPVIPGGIVDVPVRDQEQNEDCWSYAKEEFIDSLVLRDTGETIQTSADHGAFFHVYDQIYKHPEYFQELAAKVRKGEYTYAKATGEVMRMIRSRPTSTERREAGFLTAKSRAKIAKQPNYVIEPGSDEPTALTEAAEYGEVPNELFNRPISTATEANNLTTAFNKIVQDILNNSDKESLFTAANPATGVNDALYTLLTTDLADFLKGSSGNTRPPFRPMDTFTWTDPNGQTFSGTPLNFMSNRLNFDPTQYAMVVATADNLPLIYEAIHESLNGIGTKATPVMFGFAVYNQAQAEQLKVWTTAIFANGESSLAGGHETLISNELTGASAAPATMGAKISGLAQSTVQTVANFVGRIFRNSWGFQGLDANGKNPATPQQSGYNGTTPGYDNYTIQQGEGPDYVFSKAQLDQAKFASLRASISTDLPAMQLRTGRRSIR